MKRNFSAVFGKLNLLKSLRERMSLVFCSTIAATVLIITAIVQFEIEREMISTEDKHAHNLLHTVVLNVKNEYQSYRFHQKSLLNERKREVKNISDLAYHQIKDLYEVYKTGVISEAEAQRDALEIVRRMRYDDGVGYVWIQDTKKPEPTLLMHPTTPHLEGKPGGDQLFYSALENQKNLLWEVAEICLSRGKGYVAYSWPKPMPNGLTAQQPKVSYVRYFKPWDWGIGSGVYIDDIERDSQRRLDAIVDELRQTIEQIQLSETGYMFIFTGEKELIIHPDFNEEEITSRRNPVSGKLIFDELMGAAKNPDKAWFYTWNKPLSDHPEKFKYLKRAYVDYFEPLDWYIASTVYEDEIRAPAIALRKKVIAILCVFIVLAIILSAWLSRSLTKPLQKLTWAAQEIETTGIEAANVPVSGTLETRELGRCLESMLQSINNSAQEKERMFQAQQRSEENLQITLNSIGDAVIATDTDGRITRMNPVAQKLTGWSVEDARGQFLTEVFHIIHAKSRKPAEDPIHRIIESGKILGLDDDMVLISKDKTEYRIADSGAPIRSESGETFGVVLVFRDVTEERAMQELLDHRRRMDAVGELAGGVAHDFNNMIGGIIGASELLHTEIQGNPDAEELNNLVIETAERASDLTKKLLAFGRKQPAVTESLDVHKLLNDTVTLLKSSMDRRIKIKTDLAAENSTVMGDRSQLQSAFLNLGINASHAMPEGGTIFIGTQIVELDEAYCKASPFDIHPGRSLEVEVRDTGCGIPVENLKRIFEPFFTTKGLGKGTGLGLSAVYGTVKQHHGAVMAYSEVNVGTTFHILLPLAENRSLSTEDSEIVSAGNGETILLVDDENVMRITGKNILESVGYRVLTAEDGRQGLALFEKNAQQIDLVILDMIMPEMDGRECFSAMKKINPFVKVILSSGFSSEDDLACMKKNGLCGFIRKPYRSTALSNSVYEALNHQIPS